MEKLSIRAKITLWFAVALVLVVGLTYGIVFAAGRQVLQKSIRDNLVETVSRNVVEVEYHARIEDEDLQDTPNHFVRYGGGLPGGGRRFLDEVNQVYTALYQASGGLLYGENPIAWATAGLEFADGQLQTVSVDGVKYYVYDAKPVQEGMEDLWLRGRDLRGPGPGAADQYLPALSGGAAAAGAGGRGRAAISSPAGCSGPSSSSPSRRPKSTGGGDLKLRIEVGKGDDEVHRLARSFKPDV